MRVVLDTDVVLSAVISPTGASRQWLLATLRREKTPLVSVPLALEYEAVLKRPENLRRARLSIADIDRVLDAFLEAAVLVDVAFSWRPSLRDPTDEMVLEAAINGGADWLITFNVRDFVGAARLGIKVGRPGPLWSRFKGKS